MMDCEGVPLTWHKSKYVGMGKQTRAALRRHGIITAEAIIRTGPVGLRTLGIRGVTMERAREWVDAATDIVIRVPSVEQERAA